MDSTLHARKAREKNLYQKRCLLLPQLNASWTYLGFKLSAALQILISKLEGK